MRSVMHKETTTPKPRLSCEACTRRKVKCDKKIPCTNCQRSSMTCVPVERQRLPRGRHLNRRADTSTDSDVRDRLARLESLVLQQNEQKNSSPASNAEDSTPSRMNGTPLSHKDVLGQAEGYRSFPLNSPWSDTVRTPHGQDAVRTPESAGQLHQMTNATSSPRSFIEDLEQSAVPWLHQQLSERFLSHVDPVFKILHAPSLYAHLITGQPYLHYPQNHPSVEALDYAVFYIAVVTLTAEEVMSMFGQAKQAVINRYRLACEAALSQADFIVTEDLTVLQAFVFYLVATRSYDRSRRVWTFLSLAVRIAVGLNIHHDSANIAYMRPFDREMSKRTWYGVGLVDYISAMERGAEPMIYTDWLQASTLPLNINDADISVHSKGPIQESSDFTIMTLPLISSKAQSVCRMLNFVPRGANISPMSVSHWNARHQLVEQFRQDVKKLLMWRRTDPESAPLRWLSNKMWELVIANMQLAAVRPLSQQPVETPPNVKGSNLLKLAVNVIQRQLEVYDDPIAAPFMWFNGLFAPWHALAVGLTEIVGSEDIALMRSSWSHLEAAFSKLSHLVIDSHTTLWGPMEKLMEQAQERIKTVMPIPMESNGLPVSHPMQSDQKLLPNSQAQLPHDTPLFMPDSNGVGDPMFLPFDGTDMWPNLDNELDLMCVTSASNADTAAWAHWNTFVDGLQSRDNYQFMYS